MAFIVEDGIGRRGATSYVTVDFAKDYSSDRGRTEFDPLTDQQIEILAIRATDYIENRWALEFDGTRKTATQGLSFPRTLLYDPDGNLINGVPAAICRATVGLMQRATAVDRLLPDPPAPFASSDSSGSKSDVSTGEIHSETSQVGDIRKTTTYAHSGLRSSRFNTQAIVNGISTQEYPEILAMIRPLLVGGGSGGFGTQTIKN